MWNIQLGLLKKERVVAICEDLIGFLVDEVVNPQGDFHYDRRKLDAPSTSMGRSS